MQNAKFKMQNSKCKMQYSEFEILLCQNRDDGNNLTCCVDGGESLVSKVRRTHQRATCAVGEAHIESNLSVSLECFGGYVLRNGNLLLRRSKILSEGYNLHARIAQVVQGLYHLLFALAKSYHQSAFGRYSSLAHIAQCRQRSAVGRLCANNGGKTLHGLDVMPDDVGLRCHNHLQRSGCCIEIRNKELNGCVWIFRFYGLYGLRPMCCATIGQIIACNGCYHNVSKTHKVYTLCHLLWLYRIWWQRLACFGCTKATTSGTYIAQNHKCGSSFAPTFCLIWASSAAANRMERVFTHYASDLRKSITSVESDFQPFRLSRRCIFTIQLRHFLSSSLFLLAQRYK